MSAIQRRFVMLAVVLTAAVAIIAAAWVLRLSVAGGTLRAAAGVWGLPAELQVTALDLNRLELRDVRIGDRDAPALTAARLEVRYRPADLFGGRIRGLALEDAQVRARATPDGMEVAGWTLAPPAPGVTPPSLDIARTKVFWETPAGVVDLDVVVQGDPREGWRLNVAAQPGIVANDEAGFTLREGRIDAVLNRETAEITTRIAVQDLGAPRWRVGGFVVEGAFTGSLVDPARLQSLSGDGRLDVTMEAAGFEHPVAQAVAAMAAPPAPAPLSTLLNAHLQEARFALEGGLRRLDAALSADFQLAEGVFAARFNQPPRLTGAGGAALELRLDGDGGLEADWPKRSVTARRLRAALSGEGLPQFEAMISALSLERGAEEGPRLFIDSDLRMAPWDVAGVAAGMELDLVRLTADSDGWRAATAGRLALDGRRGPLTLRGAGLAADVEIASEDGGVIVAPRDGAAPRFTLQDGGVGDVAVRDVTMRLRGASGGRPFMRIGSEGFELAAVLRDVDFLAARPDVGARVRALAVEVGHEALGAAYDDADHRWEMRVQGPRVDGRFGDGSRIRLDGRVIDLIVARSNGDADEDHGAEDAAPRTRVGSATLMFETVSVDAERAPVMLTDTSGEIVLNLRPEAPLDGRVTVARAQVADRALLAQFAPIRLSFAGDVVGDAVSGDMSLALAASGRELGEAQLEYLWRTGAGTARFATPRLLFTPDRLQPVDVFPVAGRAVRGARGALQASGEAHFTAPTDTGGFARLDASTLELAIEDLSLTTPLGQLEAVNTTFRFADIVAPRTDGPQGVRIGAYDPGVAVSDVEMEVSLDGEGGLVADPIQGVFAGGELSLAPLEVQLRRRQASAVAAVRELDLARLARALGVEGLAMSGRVNGGGYISVDPLSLRLDDLRLAAMEPGAIAHDDGASGDGFWRTLNYETMEAALDGDLRNLTVTVQAQPIGEEEPVIQALLINAAEVLRQAGAADVGGR